MYFLRLILNLRFLIFGLRGGCCLSGLIAPLLRLKAHLGVFGAGIWIVNEKTDVFAFGVFALEVMSGGNQWMGLIRACLVGDACSSGPMSTEHASGFLLNVVDFINLCSEEQIRLAPEKFVVVCKRYKDQIVQLHAPIRGVAPFRTAIRKLQSTSEHLTALHSEFLLLCILSKSYKAAQNLLDEDIFEVNEPRELFLYCYYGGMVNIGLKRFGKALNCFHNVITAPMTSLHAIAVEAYKKYILVSLIHSGQVQPFPKYASSSAQRNLKNHTQAYVDLSKSYSTGKASELENTIQINQDKFQSDNNLGLVKQVLSSLYKHNIQRLTQTYLTLSLQDIASTVNLSNAKDAEMHVLQMIQDGEIFATINQKDGMVSFNEDPEQYKTCEMIDHLDSSIQRMMMLSNKLGAIDEQISCDPLYVNKLARDRPRYDYDDYDTPRLM